MNDTDVQAASSSPIPFTADASSVMEGLRVAVMGVISDLGGVSRPADLQKSLDLDKKLAWQMFRLAGASGPLGTGSTTPSRISLRRFLNASKSRGIDPAKIERVYTAYDAFEKLVETHAGDRTSFNSMLAGATGAVDDEWLAVDLQNRRNMFRGMSHAMGVQIKTWLNATIVSQPDDDQPYESIGITGAFGLRVLRPMKDLLLHSTYFVGFNEMTHEPLAISKTQDPYVLDEFCSQPLPQLKHVIGAKDDKRWLRVTLENPAVGNTGVSNIVLGAHYRRNKNIQDSYWISTPVARPMEIFLLDCLMDPRISARLAPAPEVTWESERPRFAEEGEAIGYEIAEVRGNFKVQHLGKGPNALACPEAPHYADIARLGGNRLGRDLSSFDAYRIRVEYPLYQSRIRMHFTPR